MVHINSSNLISTISFLWSVVMIKIEELLKGTNTMKKREIIKVYNIGFLFRANEFH